MKNPASSSPSTSPRPRLLCRLVRRAAGGREGAVPADGSDWMARHTANCPACAAYFVRGQELDAALRKDAVNTPVAIPAGLEDRIWAAVRPEVAARREPPVRARPWTASWTMPAFAAMAVVAVGALWLNRDGLNPSPIETGPIMANRVTADFTENDLRELAAKIGTTAKTLLVPPASTGAEQAVVADAGSLEQEWKALGQDTASAWKFLAANFIPTEALAEENT